MAYERCRKSDMLGDVANAERTFQANNRNTKTIRVAEKAENLRQLYDTFFLELDGHPHASVKHFNKCLNYTARTTISSGSLASEPAEMKLVVVSQVPKLRRDSATGHRFEKWTLKVSSSSIQCGMGNRTTNNRMVTGLAGVIAG